MILPTKHIRPDRSLLGVGSQILEMLDRPKTMSKLWDEFRAQHSETGPNAPITYRWFVLTLDLLYMIQAVDFKRGLILRSTV